MTRRAERREFLKKFIKWTLSILGMGALTSSVYLYPKEIKKMETEYLLALAVDDIPESGVKKVILSSGREKEVKVFLAFLPEGSGAISTGLTAFSSVCSHLGCMVDWDRDEKQFVCPCHGGRYDINGNVIGGPPPAPLTRLPVEIREGKVFVGIKVG